MDNNIKNDNNRIQNDNNIQNELINIFKDNNIPIGLGKPIFSPTTFAKKNGRKRFSTRWFKNTKIIRRK